MVAEPGRNGQDINQRQGLPKNQPFQPGNGQVTPDAETEDIDTLKWRLAESQSRQEELKYLLQKALTKIQTLQKEYDTYREGLENGISLAQLMQEHHAANKPGTFLSEFFITWCNRSNGNINKLHAFRSELHHYMPEAQIIDVYLDRDAPQEPLRLTTNRSIAKQATVYWCIQIENACQVVPSPISPDQFADYSLLFEAPPTNIPPKGIQSITPATAKRASDADAFYVVEQKGALH